MIDVESALERISKEFGEGQLPVLSIYSNVSPARPENAGQAWITRVKNALLELPEIRTREGKRDTPLYDKVLELLKENRPQAQTMALLRHAALTDACLRSG